MSNQGLVVASGTELAPVQQPMNFSQEQVQLLKNTICKGASDNELRLFLEVCRTKRMDPFSKQIYAIKRWDPVTRSEVMTFQVGIDGFRAKADETGKYSGQLDPQWCGPDGVWKDVWLSNDPPRAARAFVLRSDFKQPMTATALYSEYVQTVSQDKGGGPNAVWRKSPANQLAKCAEALAFRKAFPEQLGGLYSDDEMGQADNSRDENRGTAQQQTVQESGAAMQTAMDRREQASPPPTGQGTAVQQPKPPAPAEEGQDPEITMMFARMAKTGEGHKVFTELKERAIKLLGPDAGEAAYRHALARHGVQSHTEFKSLKAARPCAAMIFTQLKQYEQQLATDAIPVADDSDLPEGIEWGKEEAAK